MILHLKDLYEAQERIHPRIHRTRMVISERISKELGISVFLKYENEQKTGSFKIRGALNRIMQLSQKERAKGLVAMSAGNHAQGVALAATLEGANSHIIMPLNTSLLKITATEGYGAHVVLHGNYFEECFAAAEQMALEKDYIFIHPYEDAAIIAGQGTVGLEIIEDFEHIDSVVVPIGGGGLISGIAFAMKSLKPSIKIYGVVAEAAAAMQDLFLAGSYRPEQYLGPTIADGINIKTPSPKMYESFIAPLVDGIVSVNEDEIAEAMVLLLEKEKTVVEGAGACSVAGVLKMAKQKSNTAPWDLGLNTCLVLSGGNVDLNMMAKVVERGLSRRGRIARVSFSIPDRPGGLTLITDILAKKRANVLDIKHDRSHPKLSINDTIVELLLEIRNGDHLEEIKSSLIKAGACLWT